MSNVSTAREEIIKLRKRVASLETQVETLFQLIDKKEEPEQFTNGYMSLGNNTPTIQTGQIDVNAIMKNNAGIFR